MLNFIALLLSIIFGGLTLIVDFPNVQLPGFPRWSSFRTMCWTSRVAATIGWCLGLENTWSYRMQTNAINIIIIIWILFKTILQFWWWWWWWWLISLAIVIIVIIVIMYMYLYVYMHMYTYVYVYVYYITSQINFWAGNPRLPTNVYPTMMNY